MTKILLITNKSDITTDFVVKWLTKKNLCFYRFNTEEFLTKVSLNFDFKNNKYFLKDNDLNLRIDLSKIKSVYFRRPQLPKISSEENLTIGEKNFILNEIAYTLEGLYKILYKAIWINSVFAIREAENKIYQLKLAKIIGFCIPSSLITNEVNPAQKFVAKNVNVIKPIRTGFIDDKGNKKIIFTTKINNIDHQINRVSVCPTYFQNFIDKEGDIRVTVVRDKVFPAFIKSQEFTETQVDWRKGENSKLKYKRIKLPIGIKNLCVQLTKKLGLIFSAIDLVIDKKGNYYFLEINPNGQWAWIEKQLGYNISKKITNILDNESN